VSEGHGYPLVGYKMQKVTMQVSKWVSHLVPNGQVDACGLLSTNS
jgi:hypothetical protein